MFSEKVHIVNHPLVSHKLTIMRDKNTSVKDFRELVSEIGMLITYEATRDLPLTTKTVETPICTAEEPTLAGKKIAVVPILRAGLGLFRADSDSGRRHTVPGAFRPSAFRRLGADGAGIPLHGGPWTGHLHRRPGAGRRSGAHL